MAKRSRRRAKQKQQQAQRQSLLALKRNGQKAFDQQNYRSAIVTWGRATKKGGDVALSAALAEAHFRVAMSADLSNGEASKRIAALHDALAHTPTDMRLHYHLGLAQLHIGEEEAAHANLAKAAGDAAFAKRAAFPLAVAQLQLGKPMTQRAHLSADQLALLDQLSQFQRRPYTADAPATLRGFVAYDERDWESAEKEFTFALTTATPDEQAILHKYLGNIAAQREAWEAASTHWQQADQLGLQDETLRENLGELYQRLAEDALQQGDDKRAEQLASEAYRFKSDDNQLNQLVAHLKMRQGNIAAQAQQWREATRHWEETQKMSGGSFRLAYNLALAYEKMEDHELAAETWREVLRRRPRRADHVDALNDDQVARIWSRSAEAYIKDEQYEEALSVYRTAIKYDGSNLPLRMAFAEAAMTEGRFQLAENELERILKKDANYIPALMLQGDVQVESYRGWRRDPTRPWQRVLELDPNHQGAKDALTDYHLNQMEDMMGWFYGQERLREHLEKALAYSPTRPDVLFHAAVHYYEYGADKIKAIEMLDRTLQHCGKDVQMYSQVIALLLALHEDERAEQAVEKAQTQLGDLSVGFFSIIVTLCYRNGREDVAPHWVERAQAAAQDNEPVLLILAQELVMNGEPEAARGYLQQALKTGEEPASVHYFLGLIAAQEQDMAAAKKAWQQAEKLARKAHNQELLDQIDKARMIYDSPFGGIMSRMMAGDMSGITPAFLEEMMGGMMDDIFEEDDDDDWW